MPISKKTNCTAFKKWGVSLTMANKPIKKETKKPSTKKK